MNRRDVLAGALGGAGLGLGASLVSDRLRPAAPPAPTPPPCPPPRTHLSFAQQGEDLAVMSLFETLRVARPSYIDIGAYDPVIGNNTYLAYLMGSKGVLVEPNPALTMRLKQVRPRDTVLNVGIGVTDQKSADYYVMAFDQENTFSKEHADELVRLRGPSALKKVIQLPLVNINSVLRDNFDKAPDFFSIDVEGMDLEILRAMDYGRFRPKVFCVETSELETGALEMDIVNFLKDKHYSVRGGSFVNSIFVDDNLIPRSHRKAA
jgi:FkbM family methyltransferase